MSLTYRALRFWELLVILSMQGAICQYERFMCYSSSIRGMICIAIVGRMLVVAVTVVPVI